MKPEYQKALAKGDYNSKYAACFHSPKYLIKFILIPKCGSKSLKESLVNKNGFTKETFKPGVQYRYAAIIRDPVSRWMSGMATFLALKLQNKKTSFETMLKVLRDKECIDYIFKEVAFDIHTKPQWLFIDSVKDHITLFHADNRKEIYTWLNNRGVNAVDENLHAVIDFPPHTPHRIFYERIKYLMNTRSDIYNISNYYSKDYEIIERMKNGT